MKTIFKERINALRANMQANGIAVAIIPQSDPHQSEYIANHWQVRRWLSGFTGSAGTLVVTLDKALLWTDSRYFIQAADQLNGTDIILMKDGLIETPSISQYIIDNTPAGATIGIDGMVYSAREAESMKATFAAHNLKIDDTVNPIPQLWS
jgi:Xaa-Pro aminopeptidase